MVYIAFRTRLTCQGVAAKFGDLHPENLIVGKVDSLSPRWKESQIREKDVSLVQFNGTNARSDYLSYLVC